MSIQTVKKKILISNAVMILLDLILPGKIEEDSKNPKMLENVWGTGYRLNKQ